MAFTVAELSSAPLPPSPSRAPAAVAGLEPISIPAPSPSRSSRRSTGFEEVVPFDVDGSFDAFEIHDPRGVVKSRRSSSTSGRPSHGLAPLSKATVASPPPLSRALSDGSTSELDTPAEVRQLAALRCKLWPAWPRSLRRNSPTDDAQSLSRSLSSRLRSALHAKSASASPPRGRSPLPPSVPSSRGASPPRPLTFTPPRPTVRTASEASTSGSPRSDPRSPAARFLGDLSDSWSSLPGPSTASSSSVERVGGYAIGRVLGQGGFGIVREATHAATGETVAVKIVPHPQPRKVVPTSLLPRDTKPSASPGLSPAALDDIVARIRCASQPPPVTPVSVEEAALASTTYAPDRSGQPEEDEADVRERLARELAIWSRLEPHPSILPIVDLHVNEAATYIFMPLCSGGNLLQYINDFGRRLRDPSITRGRSGSMSIMAAPIVTSPVPPSHVTRKISVSRGPPPPTRGFDLAHARHIFAQLADAIGHLHRVAGVVHKDVKLENVLLDHEGRFRLADFGLAERIQPASRAGRERERSEPGTSSTDILQRPFEPLTASWGPSSPLALEVSEPTPAPRTGHTHAATESVVSHAFPRQSPDRRNEATGGSRIAVGSLKYTAPEQLRSSASLADSAVDIWALGCVLYALLAGKLPFDDDFEPRLRLKILDAEWETPRSLISGGVNEMPERRAALAVVRGCLTADPRQRWTIDDVLDSDWLKTGAWNNTVDDARERKKSRSRSRSRSKTRGEGSDPARRARPASRSRAGGPRTPSGESPTRGRRAPSPQRGEFVTE